MTRTPILPSLALAALALAACGDKSPIDTKNDLAVSAKADLSMAAACGDDAQPCCEGMKCNGVLLCSNDVCGAMAAAGTGEPCKAAKDCAGTKPSCIAMDAQGRAWPGGYCTSQCNPGKNDAAGVNPVCPGKGTCLGQGTNGTCYAHCTGKSSPKNDLPCTRMGYACFFGCQPSDFSTCDPTKKNTCPQDGGMFYPPVVDGGKPTYSGRVCERTGWDSVGDCFNGCDIFNQNCGDTFGCFATDDSGEGFCSEYITAKDGDVCLYTNGCDPGLGCHILPGQIQGVCRGFCRTGAKPVACKNGKKCVDQNPVVKSDVAGLCGG